MSALLEQGASATAADGRGFTSLHRAAEMGELEIARALLARGADPDAPATGGHTPRSLARQRGEADMLALFSEPPNR